MSDFETKAISRGLKGLLAAAVAGVALAAAAAPASATAIFLDKDEMFNPTTVDISGSHFSANNALTGPVLFTANVGTSASANTFQFLGFCVDLFDNIQVGVNNPNNVNLAYTTGTLSDNGDGSTLSSTTITNIDKLITYGTGLWNADALTDPTHNISTNLANQLGAVQASIWKLENPTFTFDGNSSVDSLVTTYTSSSFLNGQTASPMTTIFDPGHQTFAYITPPGGVPEPATWGLMIMGFGCVGAVLRKRRTATAAFA